MSISRLTTLVRVLCLAMLLAGCSASGAANTPSPLPIAKVVASPKSGEVSVIAVPASPVGNVLPVYVSMANGTDHPVKYSAGDIFMIGTDGNRVPYIPLNEAVAQAGGAAGLISSVETAGAYAIPTAAAAGAVGAAAGAALGGGTWAGALHGTVIGAAAGLIIGGAYGVWKAHAAAEERAQEQIENLSLKAGDMPNNGTESGYVFYPVGEYQQVEAVLMDTEANVGITAKGRVSR